jgi:hypothetical protein
MKIEIGKIVNAIPALNALANEPLPIQIAFSVRRLIKNINSQLEPYNVTVFELYKRLGKLDEAKNLYVIQPDTLPEFESEMDKLNKKKISLEVEKISISDLSKVSISVANLEALDWLIEAA